MEIIMGKEKYANLLAALFITIFAIMSLMADAAAYAKEPLLVIRTDGKDFEDASRGLRQELEEDFFINEMIVSRYTDISEISRKMTQVFPKLLVLMDNVSISLYRKYQAGLPSPAPEVPCVCLMASFMDITIQGMKNTTGIFYEVPIVTSMMNLRNIMPDVKIRRVGVVFRDFMEPFIRFNQNYCRKENIELISYPLPSRGDVEAGLEAGLKTLKDRERIDALWVLNDSALINAKLFRNVWQPFADKFGKPVIVGAELLVKPQFKFGTFGVVPDHLELGVQAAEMIYDIMENNWRAGGREIEQPRSVYKILNSEQAQEMFKVGKESLRFADKILK